MKKYAVKEIFDTLQGEGLRSGERSIFVRFAGCNLWNGLATHREKGLGACANWCDSDFAKGAARTAEAILREMNALWPKVRSQTRWCVITGGEPLLQVDEDLVAFLKKDGWKIAIETNGTIFDPKVFSQLDHVTVSPKKGGELKVLEGTELKVVLPGTVDGVGGWTDNELHVISKLGRWKALFVQAQDPLLDQGLISATALTSNQSKSKQMDLYWKRVASCVEFVKSHPNWRLSYQLHKEIHLP